MKLYKNEVMVYIIKEKLGAFSSFTCCNIQNDCKMEKITLSKIMMMMMMMMMMITNEARSFGQTYTNRREHT